jgi:hypothetical protein
LESEDAEIDCSILEFATEPFFSTDDANFICSFCAVSALAENRGSLLYCQASHRSLVEVGWLLYWTWLIQRWFVDCTIGIFGLTVCEDRLML